MFVVNSGIDSRSLQSKRASEFVNGEASKESISFTLGHLVLGFAILWEVLSGLGIEKENEFGQTSSDTSRR